MHAVTSGAVFLRKLSFTRARLAWNVARHLLPPPRRARRRKSRRLKCGARSTHTEHTSEARLAPHKPLSGGCFPFAGSTRVVFQDGSPPAELTYAHLVLRRFRGGTGSHLRLDPGVRPSGQRSRCHLVAAPWIAAGWHAAAVGDGARAAAASGHPRLKHGTFFPRRFQLYQGTLEPIGVKHPATEPRTHSSRCGTSSVLATAS
ncbi:hypothetical protein HPB51_022840 [Rhipicephalus microplus]|uniref:Uncharacterized protein n=1 Tax=Rhipicephalus microplus TaxID=6941 RepID=A0A9J6DQP3_RHIMP|nr:hypothetical protein HPB51_022840 [Rhipicephalus microplus]